MGPLPSEPPEEPRGRRACLQWAKGEAWAPQVAQCLPATAGIPGDTGLVPESGRSPGEGNSLQCSCLENLVDREAWQAGINGVARVRRNSAAEQHKQRGRLVGQEERCGPRLSEICT